MTGHDMTAYPWHAIGALIFQRPGGTALHRIRDLLGGGIRHDRAVGKGEDLLRIFALLGVVLFFGMALDLVHILIIFVGQLRTVHRRDIVHLLGRGDA